MQAIMQLVFCVRSWEKQERVGGLARILQDSKAKNTDKHNFLTSTDVECPDQWCGNA